jgi:hypothetical protein
LGSSAPSTSHVAIKPSPARIPKSRQKRAGRDIDFQKFPVICLFWGRSGRRLVSSRLHPAIQYGNNQQLAKQKARAAISINWKEHQALQVGLRHTATALLIRPPVVKQETELIGGEDHQSY